MGTITTRKRKNGSVGYTAQIRIMQRGVTVYQESQTFDRKQSAQAWLRRRETELEEPGDRPAGLPTIPFFLRRTGCLGWRRFPICSPGPIQPQPTVTTANNKYRAAFATITISKKLHSGSRNTPATIVIGSPMIGTQLSSSAHRPKRR